MHAPGTRSALVGAMAVVMAVGGIGASLLPAAPALARRPHVQTPAEAREADLRAIARTNGWTMAQARAYQRSADALEEALGEIRDLDLDNLVGSQLAEDPEAPPTIYLKGPSTPEIEAIVADAAVPILVVADQPYSMDELEERSIRAHEAVWDLGIPFVSTGTDMAGGGRIPMSIARNEGFTEADLDAIRAALPEDLRADVDLTVVDPPIDALLCPPDAPVASPVPSQAPFVFPSPDPRSTGRCFELPPGWGPLAVIDDPALEGLDAGLGPGRIHVTDGCVTFGGKRGTGVTLVWRAGDTRWDPAADEILFVDRDDGLLRLHEGDRVLLGGYSPDLDAGPDEGPRLAPWLAEPDAGCPTELWAVHDVERVDR